jgi:hypothetical protein
MVFPMNTRMMTILQLIPFSGFGLVYRLTQLDKPDWGLAFVVGGCLAVIGTGVPLLRQVRLNRIFLGVNVFLVIGGMGFLLQIEPVTRLYGTLMQAAIFCSLSLVGIFTTFFTKDGFIGVNNPNRRLVVLYSLYLLCASAAAFAFSLQFPGEIVLAGALPFSGILILSHLLSRNLRQPNTDAR